MAAFVFAFSGGLGEANGSGDFQPALSRRGKPKRIGTAKFEAEFSVKTAKFTPITLPD